MKRFVYVIADHRRKYVYVGLTVSPERRLRKHRSDSKHLVAIFGEDLPMTLLTDKITEREAAFLEGWYVDYYLSAGYKILNRNKTGSLGAPKREKLTREHCERLARQFSSKIEFKKNCGSAYSKARESGWLDDICCHMTVLKLPVGFWTKDRCAIASAEYATRTAFQNGNRKAYTAAFRSGWLDEICAHMTFDQLPNGRWTDEAIVAEALKYTSRSEFMRNSSSAYSIASKRGILDVVCAHCPPNKTGRPRKN
ncbi:GIY-YIG nuclease domain-containing protein [Rhizobium phage RHph_Y60]|nr:GIY-YIG nuclease domain-containing protein [Rhizobium phage RHph_Y60]